MNQSIVRPRWLFFLIFLSLIFAASVFPVRDPDVWWHLKTGEYICQNKTIPETDIFSYTIQGRPWTTFEWLSQVVFYKVFSYFSLAGLTMFKALIIVLIFILLLASVYRYNALLVWMFLSLAYIVMREFLVERPQIFTYFFTALFTFVLRSKKLKLIMLLPLIEVLWANMHGASAIIGFGILAIYVLFADYMANKTKIFLIISTFTAMFITPGLYQNFLYFYIFFKEGFNKLIMEYQTPKLIVWFIPYYIMLFIGLLTLLVNVRLKLADVIVVLISSAASLMAIRNIPVFVILATPIIIERFYLILDMVQEICLKYFKFILNVQKKFTLPKYCIEIFNSSSNRWFKSISKIMFTAITGIALFILLWGVLDKIDAVHNFRTGFGDKFPGKNAVIFIKACQDKGLKGNIFNSYVFGGYMIWRLYPQNKVFIDGRLVEYGINFVQEAFDFWKPEIWNKIDKKYQFTAAIIYLEKKYMAEYIDSKKDWVLVYWDDISLVYFKNIPENKWFIDRYGYKILRPNAPYQNYLQSFSKQAVMMEIERSIYFAPQAIGPEKIKECVQKYMK